MLEHSARCGIAPAGVNGDGKAVHLDAEDLQVAVEQNIEVR